ncbi:MAG TPA: SRPBCC family protein [Thermoleophilaceae bacterium]
MQVAERARIEASRVVAATPEAVFGFLARLENHWKLAGRWVEVVSIDDGSGRVRIHGPLGLRRTARTTVVDASPSHVMHGTAELSGGTLARVAWELGEDTGGTAVRLSAEVVQASLPDRALLTLGGRAWMKRHFDAILARLDEQLS